MAKSRYRLLFTEWKLTARSLRVIYETVNRSVDWFAEERGLKFRGRKLGAEAYINVASWHFTSLPKDEQEKILRAYLPRIESYLVDVELGGEVGGTVPVKQKPAPQSRRALGNANLGQEPPPAGSEEELHGEDDIPKNPRRPRRI